MTKVDLGRVVDTKLLLEVLVRSAQEVGFGVSEKAEEKFDTDYQLTPKRFKTLKRNQRLELELYDGHISFFKSKARHAVVSIYGMMTANEFYIFSSPTLGIQQEDVERYLEKVSENIDNIFN